MQVTYMVDIQGYMEGVEFMEEELKKLDKKFSEDSDYFTITPINIGRAHEILESLIVLFKESDGIGNVILKKIEELNSIFSWRKQ